MDAPLLTASTISYLFASEWAPPNRSWPLYVPGADVDGPDTAANLLNVAVWRLVDQEVADVKQGGGSVRLSLIDDGVVLPGLQGALIRAAGEAGDDDARDLSRLIQALDLNWEAPWTTVGGYCLGEARAAGVADLGGKRWHPVRRPQITNEPALAALRAKHDEIGRERAAYRLQSEELDDAVLADCIHGLAEAHSATN